MFISPMLLQYAPNNRAYDKRNHIAEMKFDGIRLIVSNMDELKLYTRHNNDVSAKFPELHKPPFPQGTILDGELVVIDKQGKPDFEEMMSRFQSKTSKTKVTFCAFDILRHRGIDVTGLPLARRKALLAEAFRDNEYYTKVQVSNGSIIDYFEAVQLHGLEGIVIKDLNSRYKVDTRSPSWQKVINWTEAEVYLTGYKKNEFGWLTSVEDNGRIRPAGIVEFGVNDDHKKAFRSVVDKLAIKDDKDFVHLQPVIKARVKTRNWTKNGMLRSPVFMEFIL
ncbi:DNA ligase [Paenibacillus sp. CF384]|uniref:ATP-dependent DNA ligase n=1 Tax=Paenibacillus sp. CF384 TaxID=1884382 RepID=UPI0008950B69|nr:DNA ligase [Paenibacillus sp. CF384]SDW79844.1 DNA ligase-1 [Paenibacillus sp. CF384]